MNNQISNIIAEFKAKRWESNPYEKVIAVLDQDPALAEEMVGAIIGDLKSGPTFLHYAIDCLPTAAFEEMVKFALDAFQQDSKNKGAEDLIAHASLRSPQSLHPHLERIFKLKPNWSNHYAQWPWRESGASQLPFLKAIVAADTADSEEALTALMETRQPEAFDFVFKKIGDDVTGDLLDVGFDGPEQHFRKLYTDASLHLGFPAGYFNLEKAPPHMKQRNATWHLPASGLPPAVFGGEGLGACRACGGALHNLITLPSVPPNFGVTRMASLSLQTCLSCLGWEDDCSSLFYQHDASGLPTGLNGPKAKIKPQFPAKPLLRTEVTLCPTPHRWAWQDWGMSNNRENLNRIGGHPAWIQDANYLRCPKCDRRMHHLLQLDSELPITGGGGWLWGSGGCGYVGWCDDCKVSGIQWQCT